MNKKTLATLIVLLTSFLPLQAAYKIKNGELVNAKNFTTLTPQEHFRLGIKAIADEDYKEAAKQFHLVTHNFPTSPYGKDGFFHLGVAYYHLEEYDQANRAFTHYLRALSAPRYFEEAVEYKFCIAEKFRTGAKRHLFGSRDLPKWQTGKGLSLGIYDEVIAAFPQHELAAKALYSKALLKWSSKEYKDAVDSLQKLTKRFPKIELTPISYLAIGKIYREQAEIEFQNSDLLSFAEINLKNFLEEFPKSEKLEEANSDFLAIKEIYAKGLYETAQFYERQGKRRASVFYYFRAINDFPDTRVAASCQERLDKLMIKRS